MKIYVCHSSGFDYKNELYQPIRSSQLNKVHDFVLPHEESEKPFQSKQVISACDLLIAEVSYASTGMGIELGWADKEEKYIACFYRKECKFSDSLKAVSSDFIEYINPADFLGKLEKFIEGFGIIKTKAPRF